MPSGVLRPLYFYLAVGCLILWAKAECLAAASMTTVNNGATVVSSSLVLKSPDGNLQIGCHADASGGNSCLRYELEWCGRHLVDPSALGVHLLSGTSENVGYRIVSADRTTRDSTYSLSAGKASSVRDHHNEMVVVLESSDGAQIRVEVVFRAYNDGAAFRYRFPKQAGLDKLALVEEETSFCIAGNPRAWCLPVKSFQTPYEFYHDSLPLNELGCDKLLGLPLLLEYPDGASVGIAEADLRDYAGMYLAQTVTSGTCLRSRLSPRLDSSGLCVEAALPHQSPWRVILVGHRSTDLLESNMVTSLNPPNQIPDTSWIRPGKTTFPWWNGYEVGKAGFKSGLNTQTMKYYIDFCAEQGIPYHSLDGFDNVAWYGGPCVPYEGADITKGLPGLDLQEVIAYARSKEVGLRLWMHSAAAKAGMHRAFPLYEQWGIEGVMVDFFDRDDQDTVQLVHEILALAAKHHLTVTLHNIFKPTGMHRTYPNLLTVEALLNLEFNKWGPVGSPPEHELTVPFTRMLAGPLDYHSGSFHNVPPKAWKPRNVAPLTMGTRAHELARYVVYEGYLPMVADYPEAYRNQPVLEFLVEVPTTWDESIAIDGKVGDFLTMARRRGNVWYVGTMTDDSPRHLSIPLKFLGKGSYRAEIYSDDMESVDRADRVNITKRIVTARDGIRVDLAPAGGHVMRLSPID